MKVVWRGFSAGNHSWSQVAQNISRSLIQLGHQVDIFSTNGIEHFPEDLKNNLIGYGDEKKPLISGKIPDNNYDLAISYTAMMNFPKYLQHSQNNRFGIWCYEFSSLPEGFAKFHNYCDKLLAPSNFAKQIFVNSGIPADKVPVIPHGINLKEIDSTTIYKLKTNKKTKILINLGQIHKRKNIAGIFEIFGRAFNKNDNVCLVAKITNKPITQKFELSFNNLYSDFKRKFPNHAEVEIIDKFIPNIYSLYKACDITFSPSHTEGFGLVPLESMSVGCIPVASNYGGFLDFLNQSNAFLIEGEEFSVPPDFLYYTNKTGLKAFKPNIDDGIKKLRAAVEMSQSNPQFKEKLIAHTRENYDWNNISKSIISLIK